MTQLQQLQYSFGELVRRGAFNPIRRFLYRDEDGGEERLQDAVCETWASYRRNGLRGNVLPPAILVHHCRQQALDRRRHFVPADGSRRVQNAMSDAAYRRGDAEVLRLDELLASADETAMDAGLARELCANPTRKINSAIDLQAWLGDLGFIAGGSRWLVTVVGPMSCLDPGASDSVVSFSVFRPPTRWWERKTGGLA
jgi:hypothetical protein